IAYEIERQIEVLEAGERVVQETRLWDPDRGVTRPMRSKEYAHDYRYFPDPGRSARPGRADPDRDARAARGAPRALHERDGTQRLRSQRADPGTRDFR